MKRIVVLGATGSIGQQTLEVVDALPEQLQVVGMAAGTDATKLSELSARYPKAKLALFAENDMGIPSGMNAIIDLCTAENVDCVVVSVSGVIGLLPTIAAIKAKKHIALASKEVLVAAGELIMPMLDEHEVLMTPIDSEHSALFQCVQGATQDEIDSVVLTASGGPFRGWSRNQLESVTVEQALKHPNWSMGGKITVDSATMMNKALEMIEAKWLFGLEMDQVEVVVHPQSIVHSFVRFADSSVLGQLGWPNMKVPIQYALLYPDRCEGNLPRWDPLLTPNLTFEALDESVFPSLQLAREADSAGGTMPCVFNAANEAAVGAFLNRQIGFTDIWKQVERTMERHQPEPVTLEALLETDKWARQASQNALEIS